MLIIHSLFQAFYGFLQNISKKAYRCCAVIISGTVIVSLISLNTKDFTGSGKNRLFRTEREPGTFETEEEDESTTSIINLSTINSFLLSTVLPEGLKNSVNVQLVELLINQAELRIQKEIPFREDMENKNNRILIESLLANAGSDKKENDTAEKIVPGQKINIKKEESMAEDAEKLLVFANQQADINAAAVQSQTVIADTLAVVQSASESAQTIQTADANVQVAQAADANVQVAQATDANVQVAQAADANVQVTQATDVNTQTTQTANVNAQSVQPQTIIANTQAAAQIADTNAQVAQATNTSTQAVQAANVQVQVTNANTQAAMPQAVNISTAPTQTQIAAADTQTAQPQAADANAQPAQAQTVSTEVQAVEQPQTVSEQNVSTDSGVSDEEYEVLSRIVEAEAGGEDMKGKILVANVVLNRVNSPKFPDTIKEVVFQKRQFSPIADGRYESVTVSDDSKEAASRALGGEDYSQGALYFSARSQADPDNMSWFDNNLTWLFKYGHHEFYTE